MILSGHYTETPSALRSHSEDLLAQGIRTGAITEADVKAWRIEMNRLALMTAGKFLDYPHPNPCRDYPPPGPP